MKSWRKTRQARYKARKPWVRLLEYARRRCSDREHKSFGSHGARGVKVTLTAAQVEILWHRAAASKMQKPSLDRIDPGADYTFENCQIIEHFLNGRAPHDPEMDALRRISAEADALDNVSSTV